MLAALGFVVCGLAAILWIPLDIEFCAERLPSGRGTSTLSLRGLYGAWRLRWHRPGGRAEAAEAAEAKKEARPTKPTYPWSIRPLLRTEVLDRVFRFVQRLLAHVTVTRGSIQGTFGFEDPAATGMLWGSAFPLLATANAHPAMDVAIEPDFDQETLHGRTDVRLRVRPAQVVLTLLWFVASLPLWRAVLASCPRNIRRFAW